MSIVLAYFRELTHRTISNLTFAMLNGRSCTREARLCNFLRCNPGSVDSSHGTFSFPHNRSFIFNVMGFDRTL